MSEENLPQIPHVARDREWLSRTSEAALEPGLRIIDPHHHFSEHWGGYFADDLLDDTGAGHQVLQTVYIQCGFGYRESGDERLRPVGETERVVAIAEEAAAKRAAPRIAAGIVGYADLRLGDAVAEVLAAHVEAGKGRFRGIRNSGAYDAAFRHGVLPRPPAGLYSDPNFRRGYARLADHGLSFDAWVYHPQIPEVAALAEAAPQVTLVLDHVGGVLGVGPYAGRRPEVMASWLASMRDLSRLPNVYVKLGGLGTSVFGFRFHEADRPPTSEELAAAWRPCIESCIEMFGAARCMFESNFPVDRAACGYAVLWNAFKRIASGASPQEKSQLFHDTAASVYRLSGKPG